VRRLQFARDCHQDIERRTIIEKDRMKKEFEAKMEAMSRCARTLKHCG
jgi:hypothetical protein